MDADQDCLQAELGKIEDAIEKLEGLRGFLDDEQIEIEEGGYENSGR